jgi:WD40 repeat protein
MGSGQSSANSTTQQGGTPGKLRKSTSALSNGSNGGGGGGGGDDDESTEYASMRRDSGLSSASRSRIKSIDGSVSGGGSGGGGGTTASSGGSMTRVPSALMTSGEKWWKVSPRATATSIEEPTNELTDIQILDSHLDIVRLLLRIDDQRMASGSDDGSIIIWNHVTGQQLRRLEGHTLRITTMLLLPNGGGGGSGPSVLLSGASDKTIRMWHIDSGESLRVLTAHGASVTCLVLLDNGRFCSGGNDERLCVWSSDGELIGKIDRPEEENLYSLLYIGRNTVITGTNLSSILVYNIEQLKFQKVRACCSATRT